MGLGIKRKVIDLVDSYYLKKIGKQHIPPYSFRAYVGPVESFERLPQEYIAYFKLLCGLRMDMTILDIGCGPGRFAGQLICSPHFFKGEYYGFDINKRMINWAKRHIASDHGNFHFQYVDLTNTFYQPDGRQKAESFSFPYPDARFDFVFAVSVFTHMLTAGTRNYLRQIERVLKPTGKALVTFLLLNEYEETLSPVAAKVWEDLLLHLGRKSSGMHKWHDCDNTYAVVFPDYPEAIVAYRENVLRGMIDESRMSIEKIYHGAWNGRKDYLALQDIIVLRKTNTKQQRTKVDSV